MKVLHLSTEKTWRGGEQQIVYLHEQLLEMGIESIVACREHSVMHHYFKNHGLPYQTFPFESAYDVKTILAIRQFIRAEKIEILHMHTAKGHTLAVLAGILGVKIPMVLSRRVDFPVKDNWFSRYKYNYPNIRKILCVSDAIRKMLEPDINNPDKLLTIHSGVDPSKYKMRFYSNYLKKKYGLPAESKIIGNTSALADHKDYFTFVNTAQHVLSNYEDVYFFIVGEGPLEPEIREYIVQKNLNEKIIMTGFLSNIIEVLDSFDIFLFTSKTEGLGTSVLDALGMGIPVVATKAGGVPEMISHNENGLLAEVKDANQLSLHLKNLLRNPELGKKLAASGRQTIHSFSTEQVAKKTLEVYRSII